MIQLVSGEVITEEEYKKIREAIKNNNPFKND
jgi:hypothetical protein